MAEMYQVYPVPLRAFTTTAFKFSVDNIQSQPVYSKNVVFAVCFAMLLFFFFLP